MIEWLLAALVGLGSALVAVISLWRSAVRQRDNARRQAREVSAHAEHGEAVRKADVEEALKGAKDAERIRKEVQEGKRDHFETDR